MRQIPQHRQFTRLEIDALRWLLRHRQPERLGRFLLGLRNQSIEWLMGRMPDFDSPLSLKQWDGLCAAYERQLRSMEYERRLKELRGQSL